MASPEIGDTYPGTSERIVQKLKNPNGPGYWLQGENGGVFAVEGAPYLGSYFDENMAGARNDPNRRFTNIVAEGTGYRSISSNPGELGYGFFPTAPVQGPAGGAGNTAGTSTAADIAQPEQTSGRDIFLNTLVGMGFTRDQANSLGTNLWTNSKTKSQDALYFDLISSPEYAARFPGMKALREQGTAMNESQYVSLERSYKAVARSAGLPENFYDSSDDFGKLIANGVSPEEYSSRVQWAATAALSDPILLDELARQNGGNPIGDATAFYLDPDRGTQVLEQNTLRAQTGAAARRSGFGQLSMGELEGLQGRGVTAGQATERFDLLGSQQGLMANTAEESVTDQQFTREEALGTVTDPTGQAAQELDQRRRRRQANFQGGGGAASGGGGRTGLG